MFLEPGCQGGSKCKVWPQNGRRRGQVILSQSSRVCFLWSIWICIENTTRFSLKSILCSSGFFFVCKGGTSGTTSQNPPRLIFWGLQISTGKSTAVWPGFFLEWQWHRKKGHTKTSSSGEYDTMFSFVHANLPFTFLRHSTYCTSGYFDHRVVVK